MIEEWRERERVKGRNVTREGEILKEKEVGERQSEGEWRWSDGRGGKG